MQSIIQIVCYNLKTQYPNCFSNLQILISIHPSPELHSILKIDCNSNTETFSNLNAYTMVASVNIATGVRNALMKLSPGQEVKGARIVLLLWKIKFKFKINFFQILSLLCFKM